MKNDLKITLKYVHTAARHIHVAEWDFFVGHEDGETECFKNVLVRFVPRVKKNPRPQNILFPLA